MPVKFLIKRGFGFSPGSPKYIVLHGLSPAPITPPVADLVTRGFGSSPRIVTRGFGASARATLNLAQLLSLDAEAIFSAPDADAVFSAPTADATYGPSSGDYS